MKGISSVIASVLMLVIVVALGGTAYLFVSDTFSGSVSSTFELLDSINDTVTIRNSGTGQIASLSATLDGNPVSVAIIPQVPGLVSHWTFNDGSGSVARDSQHVSDFEIRNLVSWVDGKFGKAVKISESAAPGCITTQNAGLYTNNIPSKLKNLPQGAFTQVWWNYLPQNSGTTRVHMASVSVPGCGTCSIWNTLQSITVRTVAGGNSDVSYSPPSINAWHQMVYTFDRTALREKLYINGTLVKDQSLVSGDYGTVQWLAVGVYSPGCTDAIPGAVYDEYSIYDRVLTDPEIQQLYSGISLPGQTAVVKPLVPPSTGTHTLKLCTSSMCNTAILTVV